MVIKLPSFGFIFTGCLLLIQFFSNSIIAQNFEHVTLASGLNNLSDNNGVAVADFDGDLDLDVFVVAKEQDNQEDTHSISKLFRNNNDGSFTDVTTNANLDNLFPIEEYADSYAGLDGVKMGVFWGDYDNDGFPDIFFTHSFKLQLFHNQGDGTFLEVTNSAGIIRRNNCRNTGATWVDYNNDSYLDLFINEWGECGNLLYKNNGDGTFENVSQSSNINSDEPYLSFSMLPYDFNEDGWIDFYVCNDKSGPNRLFINQNGSTFIDEASTYNVAVTLLDAMGVTMGDYNNDGNFEFFMTGINENALLEKDQSGYYTEIAFEKNVTPAGWGWGCKFSDFDLDGDEDLFVVNGFRSTPNQENIYFENLFTDGQNIFERIDSNSVLNDATRSSEAVDFDYDNDGDLDIYVANSIGESLFYENKTINNNQSENLNWLKVHLQGTISNRDAIGTKVKVTTSNGSMLRYQSGIGFLSQSLKPVHFGLNGTNEIEEIEISWPSGLVETFLDFETNVDIKFTEGSGYEILNIQPSPKIYGCTDPNSCTYNPLATFNNGSCEYIPAKEIIGNTESGLNSIEAYRYPLNEGASAVWSVKGGELVSGQGTGNISVKWGVKEIGEIAVYETSDDCIGETSYLNVNLNVTKNSLNLSIARIWNEALLEAIRNDYARPTVHARNLFHTSVALYDVWAIYYDNARPYLIGNSINNFESELNGFTPSEDVEISVGKAMSYAVYRLLTHRFSLSPGGEESLERFNLIMNQLGYDTNFTSLDYESGDAAALGNYVGQTLINYGLTDGAQEINDYENLFYNTVNNSLILDSNNEGTGIINPNRWQPLSFDTFIDQSGNLIIGDTPSFLSPEWGSVYPFALKEEDKEVFQREGGSFTVYHNPDIPPQLDITANTESSNLYKWNFALVSKWSSHLDPTDGVMWDISPKSIGNIDIESIPSLFSEYSNFYNEIDGGDISFGHNLNPSTGLPYETQMVPRADYARVLAEFWADGPDSETPPGHWFTILNYVNDHPLLVKKFNGKGDVLTPLEWDVKSYFILAGAMHDSAITAWGIKGWYDYIRPISAIRYMCELGQSSNVNLPNYHIGGIPLDEGFVEVVEEGDELSGPNNEHVGKIKLYAWKGHDEINDAETDVAGVDWILAENWWPYQRPSFVTPPFAGYVSGHSTFSRAAAEVMTLITGDEFFPGGIGEFVAKKDEFLVFEKGPSVDVILQWATYRDASDQTSLSRIWGGIHPPADDLPGRLIGEQIGVVAYNFGLSYFSEEPLEEDTPEIKLYPNPVKGNRLFIKNASTNDFITIFDYQGKHIEPTDIQFDEQNEAVKVILPQSISAGLYVLRVNNFYKVIIVEK
ncbi:FG-GAP-like repeat-containing protein [Seonamhaeicola sp. MEBiC1930]|uniref:FG-GAP-like repeat-containing protein n=1 Tax=Seonamhaeicola sp. MEBiC01930 TaxID=2976768 RepID=UPI0032529CC7